jgi:hypothetical protein
MTNKKRGERTGLDANGKVENELVYIVVCFGRLCKGKRHRGEREQDEIRETHGDVVEAKKQKQKQATGRLAIILFTPRG